MNEALAARLRKALAGRRNVVEKKMFGGVCFLLRGNMLCGMGEDKLMFRVGRDQDAAALKRRGAKPMDFTGRAMKGFVWVDPEKCDARALRSWIAMCENYVAALPPKRPIRGRP
ncbi:MAG: TfoX/Sxy family protein [Steroidobacteraceae bacterium]